MKRIALVGGTGKTGNLFLEKALHLGHEVRALARDPQKIRLKHPNLHVVKGDVLNVKDVDTLLEGTDIVFSLFGHVKGSPPNLQSDGTRNLVEMMKAHNMSRIISLSGGGLSFPEKDQPGIPDKLIRLIMKIAVPNILNDAKAHAKVLRQADVKWIIVRAPRLTNDPEKGTYRVGWVGVNSSTKITRGDLANFLTTLIEERNYIHQMPFVSD